MIFKTSRGGYTKEDKEAINYIQKELLNWDGYVEILIRPPKRTSKQNKTIHALFYDLSVELEAIGIEYKMGKFVASWTPESAKEFFVQVYLAGKRTSQCTVRELSNAVDKLIYDVNRAGGGLSIKKI